MNACVMSGLVDGGVLRLYFDCGISFAVYVAVYVCMYIYIYIYVYTYTHTHTHTHTYIYAGYQYAVDETLVSFAF